MDSRRIPVHRPRSEPPLWILPDTPVGCVWRILLWSIHGNGKEPSKLALDDGRDGYSLQPNPTHQTR